MSVLKMYGCVQSVWGLGDVFLFAWVTFFVYFVSKCHSCLHKPCNSYLTKAYVCTYENCCIDVTTRVHFII